MFMAKSLGRARAERMGAKAWTPLEMLEDLVRRAQEGEIDMTKAVIVFEDSNGEEGNVTINKAGVTCAEEFMLVRTAMVKLARLD